MSDRVALKRTATAGRLAIAAMTAAFLGGCSADAIRMEAFSNPLAGVSNPFSGLTGGDTTGSIEAPAPRRLPRAASAPASTFKPPSAPGGSLAKYAQPVGGPVQGWSAAGGSSVVMANGESLTTLSQRYGVPEQAILNANGLSSASQLSPGSRLTIPVYNAAGSAARTAAPAPSTFTPPAPRIAAPSRAVAAADDAKAARARLDDQRAQLAAARNEAAQAKAELEAEKKKLAVEQRRAQSASLAAQTKDARAEKALAEAKRAELKAKQDRIAKLKAEEAAKEKKVADARAEVKKQAKAEARARDESARQDKIAARDQTSKSAQSKSAQIKSTQTKPEATRKADAAEKPSAKAEKLAALKAEEARKAAEAKAAAQEAKEAKLAKAKTLAEQKAAERKVSEAKAEETRVAKSEAAKAEVARAEAARPEPVTTASVKTEEKSTTSANGNPEFRWPARGRVIQGFRNNGNDGINIALPEGTAVKAAESGVVAYAGSELKNLGNLVLIRHPNGYVSAYAHNGELDVKRGDQVKRGQTIAKSGQSGAVQSPQLHFELRKGSTPVDPSQYLAGL